MRFKAVAGFVTFNFVFSFFFTILTEAQSDLPFKFIAEPENIVTTKGSSVLLNCSVERQNRTDIITTWLKDDYALNPYFNDVESHLKLLPNGSLWITGVQVMKQKSDEGKYTCLVSQANNSMLGTQASTSAQLRIAYLQNNFTLEPTDIIAYRGGIARLQCAIQGFPPAVVSWTKNGQKLPQDERYVLLPSGSLEIRNLNSGDKGSYRCTGSNMARTRNSRRASLKVNKPPVDGQKLQVLTTPYNTSVVNAKTVILECCANGKPLPHISWVKRDKNNLFDDSRYSIIGNGNLRIENVTVSDAGLYMCEIYTKSADRIVLELHLSVHYPAQVKHIHAVYKEYPSEVNNLITCEVEGSPLPDVFWTKNGQKLVVMSRIEEESIYISQNKSVHKLKISQSKKQDSGIYQCFASNDVGKAQEAVRIQVIQSENAPGVPSDVFALVLTSTEIELNWKMPPPKENVSVIAFTIHYMPVQGENELQQVVSPKATSYVIESLKPFTEYTFFIRAWSSDGGSGESVHVNITTDESYPVAAPNFRVSSISAHALIIEWEPIPKELARGNITLYTVYLRKHEAINEFEYKHHDVPGNMTTYVWLNLQSGERYDVFILPATKMGFAKIEVEDWSWQVAQTLDEAKSLRLYAMNSTAVQIQWNVNQIMNSTHSKRKRIVRFLLSYVEIQTDQVKKKEKKFENNVKDATVYGLVPDTKYEFSLTILFGDGSNITTVNHIWMPVTNDPLQTPKIVKFEAANPTQLKIFWKNVEWPNCEVYYDVKYWSDPRPEHIKYVHKAASPQVIDGLKIYTEYHVTVSAKCFREEREGRPLVIRTSESIPSEPITFLLQSQGSDKVTVYWDEPEHSNGIIIHYKLLYTDNQKLSHEKWLFTMANATNRKLEVADLKENEIYYFKMCAATSVGDGNYTKVSSIRTAALQDGSTFGIILGSIIATACLVLCITVLLCLFCRQRSQCCKACKHIKANRYDQNGASRTGVIYLPTSLERQCQQPMISHNHIDTKGGKSPPMKRRNAKTACRKILKPKGNAKREDIPIIAECNKIDEEIPLVASKFTDLTGLVQKEFDPDAIDLDSVEMEIMNKSKPENLSSRCELDQNLNENDGEIDRERSLPNIYLYSNRGQVESCNHQISKPVKDCVLESPLPTPPPTPPELHNLQHNTKQLVKSNNKTKALKSESDDYNTKYKLPEKDSLQHILRDQSKISSNADVSVAPKSNLCVNENQKQVPKKGEGPDFTTRHQACSGYNTDTFNSVYGSEDKNTTQSYFPSTTSPATASSSYSEGRQKQFSSGKSRLKPNSKPEKNSSKGVLVNKGIKNYNDLSLPPSPPHTITHDGYHQCSTSRSSEESQDRMNENSGIRDDDAERKWSKHLPHHYRNGFTKPVVKV